MCMSSNKTTRKNLEARFDAGADVTDYFAVEKAFRRNHCKERVNVDMPHWMILKIDRIAGRKGLARQAQIKEWLGTNSRRREKRSLEIVLAKARCKPERGALLRGVRHDFRGAMLRAPIAAQRRPRGCLFCLL